MNKLIKQLIKERKVTLFLAAIIAFLGIYAYYVLPRQENPDVSFPAAMIITPYPGASPIDVKDLVTTKIEDELAELDGIDEIKGISNQGLSITVVMFTVDTEYNKAMQDVRNAVADAESELPNGAFISEINTDLVETAGMIISLSGANYSYEQLGSFGELFKDELTDIDGITKFEIEGEVDKEVKVDIDIAKLNQLDLSIADVDSLIQVQNIEIPSGKIEYESGEITVKTPGIYNNIEDIKNTIISVSRETGVVTRLSDIANVYMDLEDGVEKYKQNGLNAVLLTGYFEEGKNVVLVGKDVRLALDQVKAQLPKDLIVEEVIYQPDDVSKSVNDFMINLLEGIALVVIIVFLGMGLRNALVVSTAIPLSILMTFGVMYLMKIYIHQMSLTALIVALGILVDNAIVISDTIQVRIDDGENKLDACYNGTALSSTPIFTATLTTIAAFSPLMGMPGVAGEFLGSIPRVLIISIIAAYIVSMFITPAMAAISFKPSKKKSDKENIVRVFFKKALQLALKAKTVTIIATFLVLILVVKLLMPQLPSEFFPYVDKNLFYIEMTTEITGSIDATEKLTDEVVDLLSNESEITSYTVGVGNGVPKYYISAPIVSPSDDYGQMICKFDLGDKKNRRFNNNVEFINYIQNQLDEKIAGGKCSARLLANAKPADAKVILRISGDNLDRLREVSNILKDEISKIPGTTNVRHDMKDSTYQLEVKVDEEKASNLGITKYDIQKQINVALYGSTSSVFRRDGNEFNIKVNSTINSIEELKNLEIASSMTQNKIPLKQFAQVKYGKKEDTINTYNRDQSVQLLVNELPGYDPTDIENIIEFELLPKIDTDGVKIDFDGERENIAENFGVVGLLAIFAIFVIYVILVVQFNSFMQPVVILITIPLSLIGSILGLYLFNKPLSLTAFLGIIALIGLVVKNGILLIEYINDARKAGYSIDESCIDAVGKRFNAIILSATTTVIGLVPLAISGSGLFAPMAISLMFGLIISTFLTMVVIPVVYSLVETWLEKVKGKKKVIIQE
ncbi:efflux RND transporter permease subunit [Marinisporobacter balticus]|uniref:Multidrug efflux pump subunit AcrB n=1 Tax=Marinisporobacter balticus TaxID=2018667 RepID=A0A4R2KGM2_9FIRM|nr:efflux RND transporter permease subunit [Marinisporobacter balticus]TCO72274.1 multidrug efflux pump subunit AcrB [Marinisporobacter balticus]